MKKSPFYQTENLLTREDGDHELIEITMTPKKVEDDKPIVMAAAILQNSKLHFLKFVYEVLYKFLRPGTFRLNYADTDSLCISKFFRYFISFNYILIKVSQKQPRSRDQRDWKCCLQHFFHLSSRNWCKSFWRHGINGLSCRIPCAMKKLQA